MTNIRQERVARLLYEELSIIIGSELNDPSLSLVRVTDVSISRDLRNAKVFVCHDDDEVTRNEVLQGLRRALPFMRSEVASRIGLRMAPELYFAYDETPARAERIDAIFQQIAAERASADADGNQTLESGASLSPSTETDPDTEITGNEIPGTEVAE
jgi:ribosome-binding factor A